MLNIKKILVPVDFPNTSLRVIHQAAMLAGHFHSEIVMLHVITEQSRSAGVPANASELAAWDMLAQIVREAGKDLDPSLGSELAAVAIKRVSVKGPVASSIVQTAMGEKADLIMMPSHGRTFFQFLLGSATAKVLQWAECPIWTDAHVEGLPVREFALRRILCAVDYTDHNRKAVSWAAQIAATFGARLTLAHVTPGVELWGPGGNYVKPELKEEYVGYASRYIEKLQQAMGIEADVFIGSGDMPMVLGQAAKQTKADLLVTGCRPYGLHLRTHGYAIICAVPIPVLSM